MKRADIEPQGVYSLVSYRDSRQGWPVMILSTDSYQKHHRTHVVTYAGRERLVQGDWHRPAVGLLTVKLGFSMNEGEDVLEFRAKVEQVRELASVVEGLAALNVTDKAWDDREHLMIRDAEGDILGHYELLTGLQMVMGDYVALTLAERQRERMVAKYADEAEQTRVANVATFQRLAERLDKLGITGYWCAPYESPTRFERLTFEDMERLIDLAEEAYNSNIRP